MNREGPEFRESRPRTGSRHADSEGWSGRPALPEGALAAIGISIPKSAPKARKENRMKTGNPTKNPYARRILSVACAAAALALAISQPALAGITPPSVPENIEAPEGNVPFLLGHATGTQNYVCLPSGKRFAWALSTPQATAFDDDGRQIITHFFSPNPYENEVVRPMWQSSRDTSGVWARAIQNSSDPGYVAPGSVVWLLLQTTGAQVGPTGGAMLTRTTYIQRVNTTGGVAPSSGCSQSDDVGARAFVPYTADYYFYTDVAGN